MLTGNYLLHTITDLLVGLLLCTLFAVNALACPDIDGLVDVNCDRQIIIVTFGDSITYGIGDELSLGGYPGRLTQSYPNAIIHNQGNPGENTINGRQRASTVFALFPNADYTIVLEGINDYWIGDRLASTTVTRIRSIASTAQTTGAVTLISNLTAVRRSKQRPWVSDVNNTIRHYASINSFALGEGIISGDLLHPNAYGYQQLSSLVAFSIQQASESARPIDTDGDNLYDFKEIELGSDIFDTDSDDDGLLDGEDFGSGGSPVLTDSDNDGIGDYEEVKVYGTDPGDPHPSSPTIEELIILVP